MRRRRPVGHSLCTVWSHAQADRARHRLNFLLKQAEIFQHFASDAAVKEAKK